MKSVFGGIILSLGCILMVLNFYLFELVDTTSFTTTDIIYYIFMIVSGGIIFYGLSIIFKMDNKRQKRKRD